MRKRSISKRKGLRSIRKIEIGIKQSKWKEILCQSY